METLRGPMELMIRRGDNGDLDLLVALGRKTFVEAFGELNTEENMRLFLEKNYRREVFEEEMKEEGAVFFIAYLGAEAVGFSKVRVGYEPEELKETRAIEVERIYVDKDYQGKKIGWRLMENNIRYGEENGFEVIWLGVWEHNEGAIRFYKSKSFEVFGEHDFWLGNDQQTDVLMKRRIAL